jgi:hypothetical protein
MDIAINAKDKVTLYIHHLPEAGFVKVQDCTGEGGSIADKRFKIGNLEIILFAEEEAVNEKNKTV